MFLIDDLVDLLLTYFDDVEMWLNMSVVSKQFHTVVYGRQREWNLSHVFSRFRRHWGLTLPSLNIRLNLSLSEYIPATMLPRVTSCTIHGALDPQSIIAQMPTLERLTVIPVCDKLSFRGTKLDKIRVLDVNFVTAGTSDIPQGVENLEVVKFTHCRIDFLENLLECTRITTLSFNGCPDVVAGGLLTIIGHLPIKALSLVNTGLSTSSPGWLDISGTMPQLEILDISNNQDLEPSSLRNLSRIKYLSLSNTPFRISSLRDLKSLVALDLCGYNLNRAEWLRLPLTARFMVCSDTTTASHIYFNNSECYTYPSHPRQRRSLTWTLSSCWLETATRMKSIVSALSKTIGQDGKTYLS